MSRFHRSWYGGDSTADQPEAQAGDGCGNGIAKGSMLTTTSSRGLAITVVRFPTPGGCVPTIEAKYGDGGSGGPGTARWDGGEQLSALLRRQPSVRVDSKILGEWVLWAADGAQVPADNTLVVYRESELRQVAGRSPEELRAIHAVKRSLDGEVLPGYGGLPRAAAERRTSSSVREAHRRAQEWQP